MVRSTDRRQFMQTALLGAAGLVAAPALLTPRPTRAADLSVTRLNDKFFVVSGAGGNVLVAEGPDSALMVDCGREESASELLKVIAKEAGGKPVKTAINTHWHWDQTGGNEAVHKAGAKIISHENTRLWLTTDVHSKWSDDVWKRRPKSFYPDETFYYGKKTLPFASQTVEYGYLPQAHTDGDIYVFFPKDNILVVGGLMASGHYPILDYTTGGWIGGMIKANTGLKDIGDKDTRIIAASGGVLTKADLDDQEAMLQSVFGVVTETYRAGFGLKEFRAKQPTKDFDAKWGDPKLFEVQAFLGTWGHVRELGRII